jgi:hypothetical protein
VSDDYKAATMALAQGAQCREPAEEVAEGAWEQRYSTVFRVGAGRY